MPTLTADLSTFTYQDAIDRLLDSVGSNTSGNTMRNVRRAVLEAYDDLVNARNWRYLQKQYRIAFVAPETGTLAYSSSTGQFTIDSGTFPSWAEAAIVEVASIRYLIKTRDSSTVLTADDVMRPIADITTGTTFTIYKCFHSLPYDFRSIGKPSDEGNEGFAAYIDLDQFLQLTRHGTGGGNPCAYAITAHPYEPARQCLAVYPHGDSARTLDFVYQRYPRRLKYNGYDTHCRAGTITASASTSITGTSTTFESDMVGAILRYGRTTTSHPDGVGGNNAYKQQVYISTYSSATAITVGEAVTVSGGYYTISDPIDLDRSMIDAFWLGCKWKLSQWAELAGKQVTERDWEMALAKAKSADSKSFQGRSMWSPRPGTGFTLGVQGADDFDE